MALRKFIILQDRLPGHSLKKLSLMKCLLHIFDEEERSKNQEERSKNQEERSKKQLKIKNKPYKIERAT